MSFAHWSAYLEKARDGYSRPVANNTRVHWCGEDAVCIQLHTTNIVTFYRSGKITLAHNGWNTVTTLQRIRGFTNAQIDTNGGPLQRIRGFTNAQIDTNGGPWLIPFEHDPKDLEPHGQMHREILRPFTVADPGPAPVDDGVGCRAGEVEEYEVQRESTIWESPSALADEPKSWEWVTKRTYDDGSGPTRRVVQTHMHTVEYLAVDPTEHYASKWQAERDVRERGNEPKDCPHCVTFRAIYQQWASAMHGPPYTRGEKSQHGYEQMCEHLDTYGSQEAWFDAYITEFREVRANRKAHAQWRERNMCPFFDGIEIDFNGRAPLKLKPRVLKDKRKAERLERKYKRQRDEIAARRARHEQMLAEQREVERQITLALAANVNVELDALRPRWQEIKERHHG